MAASKPFHVRSLPLIIELLVPKLGLLPAFLALAPNSAPPASPSRPTPSAPSVLPGKKAGADKKLSKELETQYAKDVAESPESAQTPLGPLTDAKTRKLLIALISTMNASFPDYDFR